MSSSSSSTPRTRLWTCCKCHESRIPMTIGDCPSCDDPRCMDCDVKSHASTSSEAGQVAKVGSGTSNTSDEDRVSSERNLSAKPSTDSHCFAINRIENAANHSIFVLRADSAVDKALASVWNEILPNITSACATICASLSSMHLFRYGSFEATSQPTIIVNHKAGLGVDESAVLQAKIHQMFLQASIFLPRKLEGGSDTFHLRSFDVQLLFKNSRLRRSVASPPNEEILPPICEPRYREFNAQPGTGASIGIQGSFVDTATLGCYLMEGSTPVMLTVDHLLPQHHVFNYLTHLSLQDSRHLLVPMLNSELRRILMQSSHSCGLCAQISKFDNTAPTEAELSKYTLDVLQQRIVPINYSCSIRIELKQALAIVELQHQAELLGELSCRSFQRPGPCIDGPKYSREMDWAVYSLSKDEHRLFLQMQHNQSSNFSHTREMRIAPKMVPGALVKSLGRTSGHQSGQISNTLTAVYHETYITHEWCVLKRPETSVEDWVEGGVGVEGDSGGLIVDEETNELYGMLWGRVGDDAETVTLFTPLEDVLHDIRAKRSAEKGVISELPTLLRGQIMPDKAELFRPMNRVPSMPLLLRQPRVNDEEDDDSDELSSAFSHSSLGPQAHTASGVPRHLPFERYRSHAPGDAVPPESNTTHPTRGSMNNEYTEQDPQVWPGTHTYFRYAIAPEVE